MPFYFDFFATNFRHRLKRKKCAEHGCPVKVAIGGPYCQKHIEDAMRVRIDNSTIPDAGLGVFAVKSTKFPSRDGIVFKANDIVMQYTGELIDLNDLNRRYGKLTAPYVMELVPGKYYSDCALERNVCSLINHAPRKNANVETVTHNEMDIFIVATRDIRAGEELFYDYGKSYWATNRDNSYATRYYLHGRLSSKRTEYPDLNLS